eukprot:15432476-Alexandrium_andersonii.AAC.1
MTKQGGRKAEARRGVREARWRRLHASLAWLLGVWRSSTCMFSRQRPAAQRPRRTRSTVPQAWQPPVGSRQRRVCSIFDATD